MYKNKITSFMKLYAMILMSLFEIVLIAILIIAMLVDSTNDFRLSVALSLLGLCIIHYVVISLMDLIFSRYGRYRIIISKNNIVFKENIFSTSEDYRIIYSKISFQNFFKACAGELTIIKNDRGYVLGFFTRREIEKMKRLIPNITDEAQLDNVRLR
ncbi:MAG: hypothetical protein MZU97_17665 [Bacillus subtilis]|nr:hypothetical protein [Bacillus subtilis]